MIVETAYAWRRSEHGFIDDEQLRIGGLPASPVSQRQNLELVMHLLAELPDNKGCGIYYWEPLCVPNPDHGGWDANMGILDESGKAMDAILAYTTTVEEMHKEPDFWPELRERLLAEESNFDDFTQGVNLLPNGDFFNFEDTWNIQTSGEEVTWQITEGEPGSTSKTFTVESQKNFTFCINTVVEGCEPGEYVLAAAAKGVDTTGVDVRLFAESNGKRKETMIHPVDKWTGYRVEFTLEKAGNMNVGIAITSPPIFLSARYFKLVKKD